MQITGPGNVGIGTASPYSGTGITSLTVNATSYPTVAFQVGGTNVGQISGYSGGHVRMYSGGSGNLYFNANGSDNLFIQGSTGNVGIATSSPQALLSVGNTTTSLVAIFGGGQGKLTAGTFDPVYTIGDARYATYLPGMTGVKEETTGVVTLQQVTSDKEQGTSRYEYTIDFNTLEKGSDLWLFSKTTLLKKNFANLTVLLTPAFEGKVWYEKDVFANRLTIFASPSVPRTSASSPRLSAVTYEVSYRLTAPRFDAANWPNENHDGVQGLVVPEE
ncbi:MAG: hypothetical protein HYW65_01530 [Candidatus Liptonbacteria bacterium]|nr:hypothetical protein [Candidatus Liptonbacteria bacterium]